MMSKAHFDAIVVGAGPAGSTAAYLLAKNGFQVLLLDKKKFPRTKLCAGLLTRKTVKLLETIFQTSGDYLSSNQILLHRSCSYGVNLRTKACIRGKLRFPFHLVDRQVYDNFWLDRARQAGVDYRSGEKVVSLDPAKNQVITGYGRKYSARYILGADGAPSRMQRLLASGGFIKKNIKSGMATALELVVSKNLSAALPEYPVIYFGYIRWGYAWCFPRKDLRILGICGLNAKSGKFLKRSLTEFLKANKIATNCIRAAKSHALPYGNYLTRPGIGNILLLGDAGGLVDPLLGEGIYYAHRSGQLAAMALVKSNGNPQDAGRIYHQYLSKHIIPELRYARIFRQIIFSLPGSWPAIILASIPKAIPLKCEETIQGQRSFRWLRRIRPDSQSR